MGLMDPMAFVNGFGLAPDDFNNIVHRTARRFLKLGDR
jgi:hypothetical protein